MGAEEYLVHTHHCRTIKKDVLGVWKPITKNDLPTLQIEQADDVTASVTFTAEDAPVIARAILEAAGVTEDPEVTAARERVREFLRQWALAKQQHPTTVYSIFSDPKAEMADLTLADLETLTKAATITIQ
jgi:hypothetical protein